MNHDVSHFTVSDGFEGTVAAEPPLVKYPMQGAFDVLADNADGKVFFTQTKKARDRETPPINIIPQPDDSEIAPGAWTIALLPDPQRGRTSVARLSRANWTTPITSSRPAATTSS
ncbi:MAG: hypothetical protein O3C21_13570 [Verrucomicrobia bacterium]|nr:hypothetical protein [Verrucomicrobiota bacterium]